MADLQQLLDLTSRTFALAIPLLPEPARTDVTVAYLVFRIADTLEDADSLPTDERIAALAKFKRLLEQPSERGARDFAGRWSSRAITGNAADQELLAETPFVLNQLARRDSTIERSITRHAQRTIQGMASFLAHGSRRLKNFSDLKQYCYVVAGIVGEMLTDIFVERVDGLLASRDLTSKARAFGEGLQLVNMLKDSELDARSGRSFIPRGYDRSLLFNLARQDLLAADLYVGALCKANSPPGYVAFTTLPLVLARATLDCVEQFGPGSKVSRQQVASMLSDVLNVSVGDCPPRLAALSG